MSEMIPSPDSSSVRPREVRRSTQSRILVGVLVVVALAASACGGADSAEAETTTGDGDTPTETAAPTEAATEIPTAAPTVAPTDAPEDPTATPEEPTAPPENTVAAETPTVAAAETGSGGGGETPDPALVEAGAVTFASSCARCHGDAGEGTNRGKPLIGVSAERDLAEHITIVTEGKGRMPAWGARLTEEQILEVVTYVRATF